MKKPTDLVGSARTTGALNRLTNAAGTPAAPRPQPRKSRKEVVAFAYGQDMTDVDEYQPGRTSVKVFTGIGDGYACAIKPGETLPAGFGTWRLKERDVYGFDVHYAEVGS